MAIQRDKTIPAERRCRKCGVANLIFRKDGSTRCRSCGFEEKVEIARDL
jgi:uncharacterized Zn finger protein (UPF0148 family)